jgi:UDP-GlcNAc:undecaprenyl-phosphate GlcNAc-1-phosphate transferase
MFMLTALVAFGITVTLILTINSLAKQIGWVDRPDSRKTHVSAVPVTGGAAMFLGALTSAALFRADFALDATSIIGLGGFLALGITDDLLNLRPVTKLAIQVTTALVMLLLGHAVVGPAELFGGSLHIFALEWPMTVVFIVGLANAFNMMDGLDGLGGGIVAVTLVYLSGMALMLGMPGTLALLIPLLAAVLGFLVFNARHRWRRSAMVFMGDSGSLMLGAAVASFILTVATAPAGANSVSALPALMWLVALPAFDMLILIARRLAAGRNPLHADRCHIHHVLLEAGLSVTAATATLVGACAICGAIGVLAWHLAVPNDIVLAGLLIPLTFHFFVVSRGPRVINHFRAMSGSTAAKVAGALTQPPGALR